jgi:hypothetical protein
LVKYHANMSPRSLSTVRDHIREYPARWELLRWYKCWRKLPYPSDLIAALIAEERPGYSHYPCPYGEPHWHIGRGGNKANPAQLTQRAKRVYRKAVRDEIWADYEQEQQRQEAAQQEETDGVG